VRFEDPRFGAFEFDLRLGRYNGRAIWEGVQVKLNLAAVDDQERDASLACAHRLWSEPGWAAQVHDYAVKHLLPVKNRGWLDEGEAPLTPAQFIGRMRLVAIDVEPDGHFTFWHDDGDLFWGHAIEVGGTLDGGPNHADTPG
jgi:hypothetical protein